MRVAICTDQYLPMLSGLVDVIDTLQQELRARGHAVRTYAPALPGAVPDPHVFRFPGRVLPGAITLSVPLGAMHDIRAFKPDVIHTHLFGTAGWFAWSAAQRLGVSLVGTDHTFPADYLHYLKLGFPPMPALARAYAAFYYQRCDLVTAPSDSMLEELRAHGLTRPTRVVPNPVPKHFRPLSNKDALKARHNIKGPAILSFGRLAQEKNLDETVRIFRDIAITTNAELVFIGSGPHQDALEQVLRTAGLSERSHFLGLLRGEALAEAINACDVYLITSTSETQSMTTIQALACGLPVVAAKAGGLPEYVKEGETGFLVPPEDHAQWVARTASLVSDEAMRTRFSAQAPASVERFSPAKIAEQYEAVYTAAMRARMQKSLR